MKIPKGMTEDEVIKQIQVVVNRIASKYTFYGYTVEDIKQEAFIICMEALNRYDGVRPLENFLSVNLSNRLKTFMRDNFYISSSHDVKKKISQPAQLEDEDSLSSNNHFCCYFIDFKEMINAIDTYLPASIRMDYLKMINDINIPKQRKAEVINNIKMILEEHGYKPEEYREE